MDQNRMITCSIHHLEILRVSYTYQRVNIMLERAIIYFISVRQYFQLIKSPAYQKRDLYKHRYNHKQINQKDQVIVSQLIKTASLIQVNTVLCYAQSLSCVQLFATPWTTACQVPLSMGILQARILEWVVMPSSRRSFQPRDRTQISHIAGGSSLPSEPPGKPKNIGVGSLSLLQGIFLTQESNQGLPHCR